MDLSRRQALAAIVTMPEIARVAKASVRPGDVIVFECDFHISDEAAGRIRAQCADVWPDNKVVVLTAGLRIKVLSVDGKERA